MKSEKRAGLFYCIYIIGLLLVVLLPIAKRGGFYIQSDDFIMRNIIMGLYTSKPDAHAVFLMYPLSFILKSLYLAAPSVPWYGLLLYALHILSIVIILLRVGRLIKHRIGRFIAGGTVFAIILFLDFDYLVANEFTVTAGLLSAAAVFLIATADVDGKGVRDEILVTILLLFSMWYRFAVFEMAVPFLAVAFGLRLYRAYGKETFKKAVIRSIALAGVLTILVVSSKTIHNIAYHSDEWKNYYKINSARAAIFDYDALQPYEKYCNFVEGVPVSKEDYIGLQQHKYAILEDLTFESVEQVAQANTAEKVSWRKYYSLPRKIVLDTADTLLKQFGTFGGLFSLILFVAAIALGTALKKNEIIVTAFLSYGGLVLALGYFTYKERVLNRVTVSLYLMVILLIIASLSCLFKEKRNISFALLVDLLILCGLFALFGLYKRRDMIQLQKNLGDQKVISTVLADYMRDDNEAVYLVDKELMPLYASAFAENGEVSVNQIYVTNWLWKSPIWEEHKRILGIENIRKELLEYDNICYIGYDSEDCSGLSAMFSGFDIVKETGPVPGTVLYRFDK